MGRAYYNEIDPYCVQWLKNLMNAGLIPAGDVDSRSIEDVRPSDLSGYTQCHFFAGLGGWAYAARLGGIADDESVWTGSCPCQPFSQAGKGEGFADERHLWPAWFHLISQCKPSRIFGEQVASKDANPWIDLVQDDLEAMGYAFGAVPFPAASVGAPHIRDRLYWVADSDSGGSRAGLRDFKSGEIGRHKFANGSSVSRLGNPGSKGLSQRKRIGGISIRSIRAGQGQATIGDGICTTGGLGNPHSKPAGRHTGAGNGEERGAGVWTGRNLPGAPSSNDSPSSTNGFWRDADWLLCRDGKWRPVEPGTFPLAHGVPARVGKLRAYGNAIVPQEAAEFIKAVREAL